MTPEQENALLRGTLREILRIIDGAQDHKTSIAIEDALTGRDAREWRSIIAKARSLVKEKP